jgi:hypothetical protein
MLKKTFVCEKQIHTNIYMNNGNPNNGNSKWSTVRCLTTYKLRLQKLVRRKADREDRHVTESELANQAIASYCRKEEKKLGMQEDVTGIMTGYDS